MDIFAGVNMCAVLSEERVDVKTCYYESLGERCLYRFSHSNTTPTQLYHSTTVLVQMSTRITTLIKPWF